MYVLFPKESPFCVECCKYSTSNTCSTSCLDDCKKLLKASIDKKKSVLSLNL